MRLVSPRFPYLPVQIEASGLRQTLEALVDTGFEGDASIAPALAGPAVQIEGYQEWTLANGARLYAPYFLARLTIAEVGSFEAEVVLLSRQPILGRRLIGRLGVFLDHGQRVVVEA